MRGEDSCLFRTACISVWVRQLDSTALVNLSTSCRVKKSIQEDIMFDYILLNNKKKRIQLKQLFDVILKIAEFRRNLYKFFLQGRANLLVFCRLCRISCSIETSKIRKLLLGESKILIHYTKAMKMVLNTLCWGTVPCSRGLRNLPANPRECV